VPGVPFFSWDYRHVEPEYWLEVGPATKLDYTPEEVQYCYDWTEESCIEPFVEGNWWNPFAWYAHSYYLVDFGQCGPFARPGGAVADETPWDRHGGEDAMVRLREGFTEDIRSSAALQNHSLLTEYKWTGWAGK
jgi:hypothetical protein